MSELRVGFGRVNITPSYSVPLYGYSNSSGRMSERVLDPLFATCLAFTDGDGETALIYTLDMCSPFDVCTEVWRPAVSETTGIPVDHIMVSATHNHSAPDCDNTEQPSILCLREEMKEWFVEAACKALDDRRPATIYVNEVVTRGMNFVRQYVLENGTYAGPGFGSFRSAPIKCHESKADPMLRLVKFVREGGNDILMANFQTHVTYTGGGQKLDISADLVGAMRAKVERELGYSFAYFTGGAGNLDPKTRIESERVTEDYIEHGELLAAYAIGAEGGYRQVPAGKVRTLQRVKSFPTDHSMDYLVDKAQLVMEQWKTPADTAQCTLLAREYGMNSAYHAKHVIEKSKYGAEVDVELNAVSVGSVAFAIANYEMFDVNATEIRTGSPFEMTFVLTSANMGEYHGYMYIPSQMGFAHGGYSADTCIFLPGTGEKLAWEYVHMLYDLYRPEELSL